MRNNSSLAYNVFLVIGDFLALVAAFVVAYILRVSLNHTPISADVHSLTYISLVATMLPFFILTFALFGLYQANIHQKRFSELGRLIVGCFIGVLAVISYSYIANVQIFPARLVTLYGFLLAFCFVLLFRTLARRIRRALFNYGIGIANVLIVGNTNFTSVLVSRLADSRATGYRVVGVVGCDETRDWNTSVRCFDNFQDATADVGPELHTIIQAKLYTSVIKNDEVLVYAQEHHLDYRFVPGNGEMFVGNIEAELFQSFPLITVHQTALLGWGRVTKRLFDVFFGILILILVSPIMAVICLIMIITDKGDPVFRQTRLGRYGEQIRIYKFRYQFHAYHRMTPEEGFAKMGRPDLAKQYRANGDFLEDDPRITRLGRLLRKTSLDELPQLINVIKGDMSLVGPRPLEPFELKNYGKKNLILSVKPGLTGLAVVSGRRAIQFDDRRKLDLYYVQNWSFWLDLVILIKTVKAVVSREGAG